MSIRIMSDVWALDLPDSEKIVLLALADNANDDGVCWPGIETLARKCSKSDRTIQAALKSLEAKEHLSRDQRPGKGCVYTIHPRKYCTPTPEAVSPPKRFHPRSERQGTPEAASGKPSMNHQSPVEAAPPQVARSRPSKADPFPKPDWADAKVWGDLLINRKTKRLPNTSTAYDQLLAKLDEYADRQWPRERLLAAIVGKGWGAFYPSIKNEEDNRNEQVQRNSRSNARSTDGFINAIREASGRWAPDLD